MHSATSVASASRPPGSLGATRSGGAGVLTLGEIRQGVEALPAGVRRERLRTWLETEIPAWFGRRLLPIDGGVADRWGRLNASSVRTLPAIDSLLAATALHHDLRIVTRNTGDFEGTGAELVNPWLG